MRPLRASRTLLLSCLVFVLLITTAGGLSAQTGNLLTNPGFEPPFLTVAGEPARFVAQGWSPWHVPQTGSMTSSENLQPEYYPASDITNGLGVPRIRSGTDAQQYFTFFGTHTGGVYQRVTGVTPGQPLTFSIYAYIWSSTFDDPDVSEQDGGVILQVGIDPTGGTSGESGSIIWSPPAAPQYDTFVLHSVTATAAGSAVTVFVRSTVSFPVKHNVIYLDDAALIAGSAPPTATPLPPTPTFTAVEPTNTFTPSPIPVTPTPSLTPTPAPPTFTPSPSPTVDLNIYPGRIIHTVQPGDTVSGLAALYNSSIEAIISVNALPPNGLIFVGQGLVIPIRFDMINTITPNPPTATRIPPTPTPELLPPTATPVQVITVVPPTQPPPPPVPTIPPTGVIYIVQPGDALSTIAVRFNTTTTALAQLNNIVNPNLIFVGQRLIVPASSPPPTPIPPIVLPTIDPNAPLPTAIILPGIPMPPELPPAPPPRTHRVQPRETLYGIALRYGVTVSDLVRANNIRNPNLIFWGQVLIIP